MKKSVMFLIVSIILSGCVSTKNVVIPTNTIAQMKGKSLVVTTGEKPDFTAMTATKAAFGMLGVSAMISEGNKIVHENNIDDPAIYMGSTLANDLSSQRGVKVDSKVKIVKSDEVSDLINQYKMENYILDIRTINWSFSHFPTDWDNYRVMYSSKLRLIDIHNNQLVAEGFCSKTPEQTELSPSYDQLLSNNAKVIKQRLKVYSEECLQEFKKNIFRIK